jgi:hypothetical protein
MPTPTLILIDDEVRALPYETNVAAQIQALQARIRSGDIGGNRVGNPHGKLIGLFDAADLDTETPGTINGTPVVPGHLYLAQSAPGDTDGGGVVNTDDFGNWIFGANGGAAHAPNWGTGDFDHDGVAGPVDFALWHGANS